MKTYKFNIENSLLGIRGEIAGLNVAEDLRNSLLEDIDLAIESFKEKNILSTLNCLAVLTVKLQTHVILARCRYSLMEKLLPDIHDLQQTLIKLPVCATGPTGPVGATGATGATGAAGLVGIPGAEYMGPVSPAGTTPEGRTTTVVTSSYPVPDISITEKVSVKPIFIDYSTYVVIYCNLCRKTGNQKQGNGCCRLPVQPKR